MTSAIKPASRKERSDVRKDEQTARRDGVGRQAVLQERELRGAARTRGETSLTHEPHSGQHHDA